MSNNVEAIYPLSPMQEGMLFHTIYAPGTGVYVNQVAYTFGGLNADAFRRAWQAALDRHTALRSAFLWEKRERPLQAVLRGVEMPWDERDWRGLDRQAQQAAMEALMREDRERGYALNRPPAMRLYVMRTSDDEHRVLWSFHHVVLDGWSMSLLLGEVFRLYEGLCRGEAPALPPAPQYRAYVTWLQAQRPADAEAFWRAALDGVTAPTPLGIDRDGEAVAADAPERYGTRHGTVDPALAAEVQAFARRNRVTVNAVVQGAWALLLSRYSGEAEVVFGVTVNGRPPAVPGAEQTVGLFINTIPCRVPVRDGVRVGEWLEEIQRRHAATQQHDHVPLVQVQGWSQVPRDQPLFESLLVFQNFPSQRPGRERGGVEVREVKIAESTSVPLSVVVGIGESSFLKLMWDRTRIGDAAADRLLRHLPAALAALVADGGRRLGELQVAGAEERTLLLEGLNPAPRDYPAPRCIHHLVEAQVDRTPDAPALVHGTRTVTYAQLDAEANRIARHLRALGVGPETPVGVCASRTPALVAALLGVMKAGGAYLPLDPVYPADRLRFMLEDAQAPVVLTEEAFVDRLPVDGARVVCLDRDAAQIAARSGERMEGGAGVRNLAYFIYTSGSTGRPKGVMIEHASVDTLVRWTEETFSREEMAVVLASTSICFDMSVFELFAALALGSRVVLADNALHLPALPAAGQVTLVNTVPSAGAELLHAGAIPPSVRTMNLGGEPLKRALADAMFAAGVARVCNLYGPSEDTTYSTIEDVRPGEAGETPIGVPLANTRGYILDAAGRLAPRGVLGELFLAGEGLSRGYLGRPALTAERYLPDPFSPVPGGRMYRTGDRVRWLPDGRLECLGRLDHQIKIRGFRVETGEVEAALASHPAVREVVVMARQGADGTPRLLAWAASDDASLTGQALAEHAAGRLPGYMVPAAVVVLSALPLNPNGKIDRKALPEPGALAAASRVAPRNDHEAQVAALFAEVLSVPDVGATDSFFALGGHSLLAMRLVSRVREVLGVELPLRTVFEASTVAEMARAVEDERRRQLPVLPPVVPTGGTGALPLSFAQERLWFIDRMEPGSAVYNLPVAWRLEGALDVEALERALGEIVRRHQALRTTFAEADGSPVQVIAPFGGFTLPVEDLSGEAEREAAVRRRAGDEAQRAFDLAAGPLFRAALLRLGAREHVLLLSMHHVVSDGWSMGVLYRELSALYEAYREGRESPLPELPVQYADYAVWQREQLAGEVLERQLAYWRERLAGAPELLELPTDHPRPAVQTFRGAHERIELPLPLLERLEALGRGEGATLYMVLLAAFQVLLSKYSGSEDVVVGSPTAGRTRKEVEELIGFFVNTVVLRTDLSGDPGFREVLRRAREVTLGAYEHQEVPFERLVAELRPERSLSHTPLFQVMFTQLNAVGGAPALPGLAASVVEEEIESAKFDLFLMVKATEQGLRVGVNYSTDLFERGTVVRMLGHLARVLEQVAANADVRLSRLELLGDAEREQVLQAWNRTEAEVPADRCIHELFQAQAAHTPEAVAATGGAVALTYAELNARANRLARHLVRLGVGPEARVGVCLERGPELIVCNLAVLKAGGAYVAMDPAYPPARLELMLRDSGAAVLLTDGRGGAPARQDGVQVVRVDRDAHAWAAESAADLPGRVSPRNAAYVVYTSGSTGTPKGVAVDHASLCALCAWHVRAFGVTAADRGTQVASPGFDAAVWEVWAYLAQGASVHVVPQEVRADPPALRDWLVEHAATVSFIPTPVAEPLLALEWPADAALRWLLTGGDRLRARPRAGMPFALANNYGPTECTVVATSGVVEAEGVRTPSIGGPIDNTRVYVLDAGLRPLPAGVPGELCIGGAQVARGYLNRPALTAERFVPDPYGARPGARLYRSGDRVRWLPDGTVEYLGRLDEQVKVRGFRIELSEIEAALRGAPGVADCAVLAREDETGDRRLAAYVVGGAPVEALREHLRRTLPEYMVPSAFVALDALPLTANGKLDRRALPAPELASAEDRYVAPRTPVEEVLAGIWAEVLRLERVGAGDDFFALGGHSLLATRVLSRVRAVFEVELPLRALFEDSTVAGVAERIVGLRAQSLGTRAPAILPVPRDGRPLPLSFAQQRLWFVDRLQPGRAAYNMPLRMRVRGALDLAALERALTGVVRRHESLRTRFPLRDGEPVQQVDPAEPVRLAVVDLGDLPAEAREAEVERLAAAEARRPFDLAAGPLLRGTVLRLADDDAAVLLTLHHVVSDGWSMGILLREISTLYGAFSRGEQARLPDLPIQYADYAVWQREWLGGEVLQAQIDYWRARMAGAPALLELPTDRPRPLVPGDAGATVGFTIGAGTAAALRGLSRREGATLFMTLLAAWQLLLSRYSGQQDVVVGSPIAGRNRLETEGLIGFFINTLVLRADLSGDPEFGELLRRVRESTLGAYQHQELPFEKLVEELGVERSQAYTPLFQVMFILQNNESNQLRLGEAAVEHRTGGLGAVKFDLSLSLQETGEEIRGFLSYRTELWMEDSIRRMVEHYGRVLEAVAAHPEQRLSRVPLLGEAERARVLADSSAPVRHDPPRRVHELFESQAARTPGAVALVLGDDSLSYGELDRRANRLAHHLRGRGVGPEVRVAVFLERSFEMVVGILAILKAGGAYVPLDPGYPAERLAYQVRDSGATLLVTTRALLGQLGSTPAHPVLLDIEAGAIARESDAPPPCAATPENLAYVIYTSGSTGRPKGVMVPHRGVVSYFASLAQEFALSPRDVVLQRSTLSFDASVRDLLGPLTAGARVVLVPGHEAADPVVLVRRIREHRVTAILAMVPSVLRPLLDAAEEAEEAASSASLRLLLVSGEPLAVADCHRARRAFGSGVRVVNVWGATECTMSSTFHTGGQEDGEGIAPVGTPIANTRIHVLDGEMEPVPQGVAGEAYIAGVGVTRGYQSQPALTAERFLPDPFASAAGARIYRVGDHVRRRSDGALEFLGRVDQQVKIHGIRVETGEVEAVLRAHPAVREAAVVARQGAPGETRLVAYVAGEDEALAADALRSSLERTLPAHMIPSVIVRLQELPHLPNGKVDRGALPAPEAGAWRDGQGYVAPSTATERVLVEIWESLLDARPIGVDDPFFRLGGHSMLAVRLMTQIRKRLGVEVPLAALFEHPTVRGLAARVEGEPRAWSPLVAIQPHGDGVPLFFVHPVGGEVLCYADLARELGPEQPFYGLQAGDLVHLGEEEASIEEMAARYVSAIREVRPTGPYLLGGWSFGGFVAFEMARQLTRAGESAPLVAMLDTRAPGEVRPADLDPCMGLAGMARAEARAAGKQISLTADDLRPLDPDARVAHTLEVLKAAGVVAGDADVGWRAAFLRGLEVRMRSALRYQPGFYPGRVALFVPTERPEDPEFRAVDPSLPGWEAYVSEPLVKQTVPGHHNNMLMGGNAAGLAAHLRALIEETLAPAHVGESPRAAHPGDHADAWSGEPSDDADFPLAAGWEGESREAWHDG